MSKELIAWAKKAQKMNQDAMQAIAIANEKGQRGLLDNYAHLKRRLTSSTDDGSISKRVLEQMSRSERAYKGWETRRQPKEIEENGSGQSSSAAVGLVDQ